MNPMNRLNPIGRSVEISALVAWTLVIVASWTVASAAELPQVATHARRQAAAATIEIPWVIASDDEPWTVALGRR